MESNGVGITRLCNTNTAAFGTKTRRRHRVLCRDLGSVALGELLYKTAGVDGSLSIVHKLHQRSEAILSEHALFTVLGGGRSAAVNTCCVLESPAKLSLQEDCHWFCSHQFAQSQSKPKGLPDRP